MRDKQSHFPVNWMDGMKMNKDVFIQQEHAFRSALHQTGSLPLSPIRYGVLPPDAEGRETFTIRLSLDNQDTLRVTLLSCQAVTSGGAFVMIPALNRDRVETDGVPSTSFVFHPGSAEMNYWVVLVVDPFDGIPGGSPDRAENPPRLPFLQPSYTLQVLNEAQYRGYGQHPYALTVGKVAVQNGTVVIREDYIPPCFSVNAHQDLLAVYSELDGFLAALEMRCSKIVQKIYRRNQQNELSELVLFVCDRILLYIGASLTTLRWSLLHESPVQLFATVAGLARIMKNTIDLRIGTGKDELMNYLSEWCDLKQGELETMLTGLAQFRYDHNDILQCIQSITSFIKVTGRLFETLSNLEFIGKRKEAGFFVKEEHVETEVVNGQKVVARRRFFG